MLLGEGKEALCSPFPCPCACTSTGAEGGHSGCYVKKDWNTEQGSDGLFLLLVLTAKYFSLLDLFLDPAQALWLWYLYYLHFIKEETKVQQG